MAIYTSLGLAPHRSAPVSATRTLTRGDIIPAWILQTLTEPMGAVFNIEVFNTCQIPFWLSKKPFFFFFFLVGTSQKCALQSFPPVIVKASPKTACHKIQCLQFANKNTAGLQSWHSSIHFQIPITPTILTLQLQLGTNGMVWHTTSWHYNFGSSLLGSVQV